MDICFSLALGAALVARLPSPVTLSWRHSVEHVLIEEQWAANEQGLVLLASSTDGLGAGIDVPDTARLVDGRWTFQPALAPQAEVRLANSRFAAGYAVCWQGGCMRLAELAGGADRVVRMVPCGAPGMDLPAAGTAVRGIHPPFAAGSETAHASTPAPPVLRGGPHRDQPGDAGAAGVRIGVVHAEEDRGERRDHDRIPRWLGTVFVP
jgi:hypothetical protein